MLFCVVGTSGVRRLDDVGLQSPIRESLAAAPFPRINTCPRANESEQILSLLLSSCDAILRWWVWGVAGGSAPQEAGVWGRQPPTRNKM